MDASSMSCESSQQQIDAKENGSAQMIGICKKITSILDLTGVVIVCATLVSMFAALLVNVFLRYLFEEGITWAYEMHQILLPWLVAGGAVMASARGANIAVTVIVDAVPEIVRRSIVMAVYATTAVIGFVVAYSSMPIVRAAKFSRLPETHIPQMYGYISILYAFYAIAIISTLYCIRTALGEKSEASSAQYG